MSEQVITANATNSPWRTIDEVAEYYRTTPDTIRYWRKNKRGPNGRRLGLHILWHVDEIARYDRECHEAAQSA